MKDLGVQTRISGKQKPEAGTDDRSESLHAREIPLTASQDKFQNDGSNGLPCGPTNPTCLAPHATGNNRFSNLYFPLPDVNASYDAAIFSCQSQIQHGFQVDASYTWSHAIDTASL